MTVPLGMGDACETASIGGRARCRQPRRHGESTSGRHHTSRHQLM